MHNIRTLSNGIRVVSEKIDYVKSVSIGVWVGNGSRCERKSENGMSHFIEHMLFKGTEKRTARDIAVEMDSVGGQIDAYTTREYTCYYTKTLDAHAELAIELLSDMLYHSVFTEIDSERRVIYEEINMYEDDPEELVHDLILEAAYGESPLGRSILGTKESLAGIDGKMMRDYMRVHYTAGNTVISVSGNFDASLFDLLEKYFAQDVGIVGSKPDIPSAVYTPGQSIIRTRDTEQIQLVAGFDSIDIADDRVYSLLVFNNVFGSGMSGRLFQNIRERLGLAYSVYAYHAAYIGSGMFNVCVGTSPDNLCRTAEMISAEINKIRAEGLSEAEIAMAKEQLKGNYILSYESVGARMQAAGRNLLIDREIMSPEEVISKIDAVSAESTAEIIDRVLNPKTLCIAAIGPLDTADGLFDLK